MGLELKLGGPFVKSLRWQLYQASSQDPDHAVFKAHSLWAVTHRRPNLNTKFFPQFHALYSCPTNQLGGLKISKTQPAQALLSHLQNL